MTFKATLSDRTAMKAKRLVIGLTGGIASGKSLVAHCLVHFGSKLLDADRIGHEVLKDPEVVALIEAEWGDSVIGGNREINRKALGRIVFDPVSGPDQLIKLEQITHPRIGERIRWELKCVATQGQYRAIVLDAPVMFKAGWNQMCDKIIFVDSSLQLRRLRASQRGWENGELERRESRQTPLDVKRRSATDLINNNGTRESTYDQVRRLWESWNLELPTELESPKSLYKN